VPVEHSPEPRPVHPVRRTRAALHRWWLGLVVGAGSEAGQSTVEYALVLLGAAAVALALVAWVTRSDAVSRLFDSVVSRILSRA
jgi:Flp pilus assembly pilin Flp